MSRSEVVAALREQGFRLPWQGDPDLWRGLLNLPRPGSGQRIDYTNEHMRILSAWYRVVGLCGLVAAPFTHLHRDAAYELAEHEDGWVIITEQTVSWTRRPTARVFDRGAVCIPVPAW